MKTMSQDLFDILSLTGEPAILVKQGKIGFANAAAQRLPGVCEGRKAEELLGLDVGKSPARSYLADTQIQGVNYILRVNRVDGGRLVFLDRQEAAPAILNDAFLYNLRSSLMTLGIAADRLRPSAEDLGNAEMLSDLTALTSSYYKLMRLSSNASLVRDLFEHRAGAVALDLDLSLLCHAVLDAAEEPFPDVHIVREIQSGLHASVDAALFKQMLFNLLSNCFCHARATLVQVRLYDTGEHAVLVVSDNGVGIPAQAMHTVFDRYRYTHTLTEMGGGAGLGLTAARGITQMHGGTLLLESREDQGTAVHASFSRRTGIGRMAATDELCSMRDVLLGLADCLPERYFQARYLD